jgi:hypothetical protein
MVLLSRLELNLVANRLDLPRLALSAKEKSLTEKDQRHQ